MKKGILIYCFIALISLNSIAAQSSDAIPAALANAFKQAGITVLNQSEKTTDFTVPLLNGGSQQLSALRGKVVIFNMWATWCPPCRAEMPSMEVLYQKYKNMGLEILAVDGGESAQTVARYINANKFTFPIGLDTRGTITQAYETGYIPTSYIINRQGNIVAKIVGSIRWDTENVYKVFELLLTE
ncbi:MAG: hypothetical protein Ta2G_10740 [Termitinemataceae bacterium]|nr:MAG: hypothetical protein Ta2G_10740 [Termitinemataceae bacterium]